MNQQATSAPANENFHTPAKNRSSPERELSDIALQSTGVDSKKHGHSPNKRMRTDNPVQPKTLFQSETRQRMCSQDQNESPGRSLHNGYARPDNSLTEGNTSYIKNVYSPSDQCKSIASQSGQSARTVSTFNMSWDMLTSSSNLATTL